MLPYLLKFQDLFTISNFKLPLGNKLMFFKKILVYLSLLSFIPIARAENVHEYHLKNGLTLLVKEDHRSPIVISEIWYKVGSSYEPNGITGISHALEHMMFRGTNMEANKMLSPI